MNMLFLTPKISKDEAKTIKHVTTFHLKDDARKMGKKGKNYFLRCLYGPDRVIRS